MQMTINKQIQLKSKTHRIGQCCKLPRSRTKIEERRTNKKSMCKCYPNYSDTASRCWIISRWHTPLTHSSPITNSKKTIKKSRKQTPNKLQKNKVKSNLKKFKSHPEDRKIKMLLNPRKPTITLSEIINCSEYPTISSLKNRIYNPNNPLKKRKSNSKHTIIF